MYRYLIGPSKSGKTTLILPLQIFYKNEIGLMTPQKGIIYFYLRYCIIYLRYCII